MRESCRLCHGFLVIRIMVLIPSTKSQVISAAMWLHLATVICLVLFSTGAPPLDLQSYTCTYVISVTHSCGLPIIVVFCESSHTKEKSMNGSSAFSIKAGTNAPRAHLIDSQARAVKHQHKQQIKHIFILLTLNKEISHAEQSCSCFPAERRSKLKKPSDWIFDGYVSRTKGARQSGRTLDTVVASLCSSFVPQLYQPKANYFISNSEER